MCHTCNYTQWQGLLLQHYLSAKPIHNKEFLLHCSQWHYQGVAPPLASIDCSSASYAFHFVFDLCVMCVTTHINGWNNLRVKTLPAVMPASTSVSPPQVK